MIPGPDQVTDDGLQRERTALAWNRTALAMIVAGALQLRAGGGQPLYQVPGALIVAFGAWLLVRCTDRYRRLSRTGFVADRRLYLVVAAGSAGFSVASALLILFGR